MRQENERDEIEIDLGQIVKAIVSKLGIIAAIAIVTGIIMWFVSEIIISPQYVSTSKLYIINRQNEGTTTLNDIQSSTQLVKDYRVLVRSSPVLDKVISILGLEMSSEELAKAVAVSIETDSRVLEIKVTSGDPYRSKEIVDALSDVSSEQITKVMKIEGVNVIEYGKVALNQSSPNVMRNVMLGVLIGLFISAAVVVVRFVMDDSLKSSDDIEKYLGLSTLSLIPINEEEKTANGKSVKKKRRQA